LLHQGRAIGYGSILSCEGKRGSVLANLPASPNLLQMMRAQRLLDAMHPVCSHDLPNQTVAMQSLLQLFAWDEAESLSPQGREYFQRLQAVASKSLAFTQFLKDMARLEKHTVHSETVVLAQLADDVRIDSQRLFPEVSWSWQLTWHIDQVRTDRRLLHRGLLHLLRAAALGAAAPVTVEMEARRRAEQVQWNVTIRLDQGEAAAAEVAEAIQIERRLAGTLALEYFAVGDIACRQVASSPGGATTYALVIPGQSLHG
jgi:light-regulated signal transduction histidine kinase (bacteriophytochrome)